MEITDLRKHRGRITGGGLGWELIRCGARSRRRHAGRTPAATSASSGGGLKKTSGGMCMVEACYGQAAWGIALPIFRAQMRMRQACSEQGPADERLNVYVRAGMCFLRLPSPAAATQQEPETGSADSLQARGEQQRARAADTRRCTPRPRPPSRKLPNSVVGDWRHRELVGGVVGART